jgi:hypothetical protein
MTPSHTDCVRRLFESVAEKYDDGAGMAKLFNEMLH